MNWKQLREQALGALNEVDKLMGEAAALVQKGEAIPEDLTKKIDAANARHDQFKAMSDQAKKLDAQRAEYTTGGDEGAGAGAGAGGSDGKAGAAFGGWRPSSPNEGMSERQEEATSKRAYKGAFEGYMRKSMGDINQLGPNDRKAIVEGTDNLGGFFVPPETANEILRKIATNSVIRALATVSSTSRDRLNFPWIPYTTDDKYTSAIRPKWTGEQPASSSVHRVTDPTFGEKGIDINTAMASLLFTQSMLEDSYFDIMGEADRMFTESFQIGEDEVFIGGDGIGKPLGFLANVDDTAGTGPRSVASGTTSSPFFTYDGVIALDTALPPQYEANARFIANKQTYGYVRQIKTATTNEPLWPIVDMVGGLQGVPANLLSYPYLKSQFMPAAASGAFPLALGDFRSYRIVDRVGLSIRVLQELYAETNMVCMLARKRVGGALLQPERIKVQKVA